MAGLGNVALMQEPVAAVMCVMKQRKGMGSFLASRGTLDIAIAESIPAGVEPLCPRWGGDVWWNGLRPLDPRQCRPSPQLPEVRLAPKTLQRKLEIQGRYSRMCLWAAEKAKDRVVPEDESSSSA